MRCSFAAPSQSPPSPKSTQSSSPAGPSSETRFKVKNATTSEKSWKICDFACAHDFATCTPVTTLSLRDFGRRGYSCKATESGGVRVIPMLDRIAKRWNERPHPDMVEAARDRYLDQQES